MKISYCSKWKLRSTQFPNCSDQTYLCPCCCCFELKLKDFTNQNKRIQSEIIKSSIERSRYFLMMMKCYLVTCYDVIMKLKGPFKYYLIMFLTFLDPPLMIYSTVNHQKLPLSDPTHPLLWWHNTWMVPKRLNEFSEISKDFLAEMRAKLGLVLPYEFLFKLDSNPHWDFWPKFLSNWLDQFM